MTQHSDDPLDDLFAQARAVPTPVPAGLIDRVLADAASVQASMAPEQEPLAQNIGLWPRFMAMIGGWPAVGGLAAATVAGIWIGVAPPASVEDFTADLAGDTVSISLFSDALIFEESEMLDG